MGDSGNQLEVSVMGHSAKLRGKDQILVAVLLVLAGFGIWGMVRLVEVGVRNKEQDMMRELVSAMDRQAEERQKEHASIMETVERHNAATRESGAAMAGALKEVASAMNEQNWIITAPAEERERLRLRMPESLRDKVVDRKR